MYGPKRGRGRQKHYTQNLLPSGLTRQQVEILKRLAEDRGISLAELQREITHDYLAQFDYGDDEQGMTKD
jgi:hypothetical protein